MKSKDLVQVLFQFQSELKLYHWQTFSYARHKASDKLVSTTIDFIDTFIESYMGKYQRVHSPNTITIRTGINDTNVVKKVIEPFLTFLQEFDKVFKKDPELINLKDEFVATIQKTKYLFTLK